MIESISIQYELNDTRIEANPGGPMGGRLTNKQQHYAAYRHISIITAEVPETNLEKHYVHYKHSARLSTQCGEKTTPIMRFALPSTDKMKLSGVNLQMPFLTYMRHCAIISGISSRFALEQRLMILTPSSSQGGPPL